MNQKITEKGAQYERAGDQKPAEETPRRSG